MPANYCWHSMQGTQTTDNRDFCGIAEVYGTFMYTLIDGATSSPNGGGLAKNLVRHMLENFVSLNEPPSSDTLIDLLARAHVALCRRHPADCASYIIALQDSSRSVTTLHAGDCRLGRISPRDSIQWLTKPHTLANAIHDIADHDLRVHPNRHLLTRSFKGRRFQAPEHNVFGLQSSEERLIIASDGFWAELTDDEQLKVLRGNPIDRKATDDSSCLQWSCGTGTQNPLSSEQAKSKKCLERIIF